jgi:small subunit ribosomal protein S4
MTKRIESKYKINRRLGVNLWGRAKSPITKRETIPGQHGARRKQKPTDFGVQLMAKQKLKGYYGNIGEKQFQKYYQEAVRRKGDTSENLIELLERRLDAVVYRMKLAVTPFAAGSSSTTATSPSTAAVNIPSYQVRDNDQIEVKERSKQLTAVLDAAQSGERDVPDYIEIDHRAMRGRFLRAPKLADVPYPVQMEPNLVVEFYSR